MEFSSLLVVACLTGVTLVCTPSFSPRVSSASRILFSSSTTPRGVWLGGSRTCKLAVHPPPSFLVPLSSCSKTGEAGAATCSAGAHLHIGPLSVWCCPSRRRFSPLDVLLATSHRSLSRQVNMSWTRVLDPYRPFQNAADAVEDGHGHPPRFPVSIWEATDGAGKKSSSPQRTYPGNALTKKCPSPAGAPEASKIFDGINFHPKLLAEETRVRIIFAPLDELLSDLAPGIIALCRTLSIPPEFLTERLQGVCHSFGTRTDDHGVAAWFHYLCKAVEPGVAARHRWYKSAFFLRKDEHGNVTLVVFGPTPGVRARLERFLAAATAQSWDNIVSEPLVLFDLILDGLFLEIDTTVWRLLNVLAELESVSTQALGRAIETLAIDPETLTLKNSGSSAPRTREASGKIRLTRSTSPNSTAGRSTSSTSARPSTRVSWWSTTAWPTSARRTQHGPTPWEPPSQCRPSSLPTLPSK